MGLAVVMLVNREDEVSIAGNDHVIVLLQDPQRRKVKMYLREAIGETNLLLFGKSSNGLDPPPVFLESFE